MPEQTDQMQSDIARIAQSLRPKVLNGSPPEGSNVTVLPTAGIVGKRLETLIKRAQELEKQAAVVATALAGNPTSVNLRDGPEPATHDHLFGRQMAALDELGQILDSVGRQIERAQRSLS